MRKAYQIRQERDDLKRDVDAILREATAADRDLTPEEKRSVDAGLAKLDILNADIDRALAVERQQRESMISAEDRAHLDYLRSNDPLAVDGGFKMGGRGEPSAAGFRFVDKHGAPVQAVGKGESLCSDRSLKNVPLMGQLCQAAIHGVKPWHHQVVKNTMGTFPNSSGGFVVPTELWSGFVDAARAQSVMATAGTVVIPMQTAELAVAAVSSDPVYSVKAENEPGNFDTIELRQSVFVARTLMVLVRASRELVEDSPNAAFLISQVMARSLAQQFDSMCLAGVTSGATITGLVNRSDVDDTDSIGSLEWEDLVAAKKKVRSRNYEPNCYILNSETHDDLNTLAGGDGATTTKMWLPAPPSLNGIEGLSTTAMPADTGVIGDFTMAAIGLRQNPLLEVSAVAGDAMQRHQVLFKLSFRADFNLLDAAAFHVMRGIT